MKKLFIIAAAACVTLASCVKNEPVASVEQGDLITFAAPLVAPATKAVGTVMYPETGTFKLYGWYHAAKDGDFQNMYINAETVSKQDGNYFAPSTSYYWPKSGYLSFFAYSPATLIVGGGTLSVSEMSLAKSMALTYTVASAQAKQDDLLYSNWTMGKTASDVVTLPGNMGSYEGIEIVFNHALSAVLFNFSGVANMYKITSVTLSGIQKTAILTSTPASTSWADPTGDPVSYEILGEHEVSGTVETSDLLMLIPQDLDAAKLTINYSLKNPSAAEWIPQDAKVINLNSATDSESNAIAEWDMGTQYTYNITFGAASVIKFAPSVVGEWTGVTGTVPEIQ